MIKIQELIKSVNIAEMLSDEELSRIGRQALNGYEIDEASRTEWREKNDRAMQIAEQTIERKTHPFPGASNVKFPLITQAAIDFASRTYPEVVRGDKIVKIGVIGEDEYGLKEQRARRVTTHMSYQLLYESDEWEESTDKLLHILPIIGTVFRKIYYDPIKKRNASELCKPDAVAVNYNVNSLSSARRITHIVPMYANDIVERIRAGLYRDIDLEPLISSEGYGEEDSDPPLQILEQHCFLDLDEDGYQEPYIVVLHKETGEVLRIVARYSSEDITYDKKKQVARIKPTCYFSDYHFIKSPDGGFYSMGLGQLLYPINEAINTTLNQLIDAGTLSNSQAGFIGRGLRLKAGQLKVRLGEWKVLDAATGTDIRNNIVPLPVKEPSSVLLQMLGLLIESGKDLASIRDTLQGKGETQNVPATTILTMVEQGLKVFNAIQKRLYRAFKQEFTKFAELNSKYLSTKEYQRVLDDPMARAEIDYNMKDLDISPVSDPTAASDAQRIAKARALAEVPGLDPYAQRKYLLESLQISETQINQLLPPPDPNAPPPPELQKIMAETASIQAKMQTDQVDRQLKMADLQLKQQQMEIQAREAMARIEKMQADAFVNFAKLENVEDKISLEREKQAARLAFEREKAAVEATLKAIELDKEESSNENN